MCRGENNVVPKLSLSASRGQMERSDKTEGMLKICPQTVIFAVLSRVGTNRRNVQNPCYDLLF